MSIRNVFPAGSSVLDQYVISTRGTAQFGDNSNNYLVGVTPTTYNTYQVATVGNINNFGTTPQNNTGSRTGTYYSNGVSAMRIPADSSANRPPVGYAGYIRYNINTNYIEYYNTYNSSWLPISQQSPVIANVTPGYISQDASSSNPNIYSIIGSNFNTSTTITFLGVNNSQPYTTSTVFNSTTSLTTTASYALSDVSANPSGYYVVATNSTSGLSFQYGTIITFDPAPTWVTPSGSLGTTYGNLTYTTANSPFTALLATDASFAPVTYYYSSPPVGTTITLDASTGLLIGTTPIVTSTTVYSFSAVARDGLPVPGYSVPRAFSFTIITTLSTITGSAIYSVGYTDANGQNYSATTPISGGYTVYWFTAASGATFTTSAYTPTYITYLVVGGGGGGGGGDSNGSGGGGGGAGGVLTGILATSTSTGYTVTVGTGGAGGIGSNFGGQGADTTFGSIVASGGGGGGNRYVIGSSGNGSGGGGGLRRNAAGGIVVTPINPPQGNAGGNALLFDTSATGRGGGGGGVMMAGVNGSGNNANAYNATSTPGGTGGNGLNFMMVQGTTVPGAATGYGGGGGGGAYDRPAGLTYIGGGGAGALQTGSTSTINGNPATANTGGGGGGASTGATAGTSIGGTGSQGFILLRHLTIPISNTLASYTIGTSGYTVSYVNNANTVVGSATLGGYTIISFPATSLVSQVIPTSSTNNYQAASSVTQTYTFTATSTMGPVAYLIVGGGGGGGCRFGGGGGAGGVIYGYATFINGTTYTITVGAGGAGGSTDSATPPTNSGQIGSNGSNSSISPSPLGNGLFTAYGGEGGNCESYVASGTNVGSGGGASYASSTYNNPGTGTGGQGFNGGYGNNFDVVGPAGIGRNGGGGGGAGGPGGSGSTTISYLGGTAGNPETQLDSYAYGAPYGGQAIGLSINGTLTAYGGGGGGCDMRADSGPSMGYGGGGGINYTSSSSLGLGYPSGSYYLSGQQSTGYGCYGVFGNTNNNISGGRGGGQNGNGTCGDPNKTPAQGAALGCASGSSYYSSAIGEAGRHGTGGGGGGGAYVTTSLTYNPNGSPFGQPGGAGGSGIVILRFPSYIC